MKKLFAMAIAAAASAVATTAWSQVFPTGINDSGVIIGETDGGPGLGEISFEDANGVFTKIQYPGAYETYAQGINDSGEIVGYYSDNMPGETGGAFTYSGGVFTIITDPADPSGDADLIGITNSGEILGILNDKTVFLDNGGVFTNIGQTSSFEPAAINSSGVIVGTRYPDGFEDNGGTFTQIIDPSGNHTWATTISNNGIVGGYYEGVSPNGGFVESGGVFTTIIPPDQYGPAGPGVYGVNDAGTAVGTYYYHGLRAFEDVGGTFSEIRVPGGPGNIPEPETWALMLCGVGLVGGMRRLAGRRPAGA